MNLFEAIKEIKPGQSIRGKVPVMEGKDLELVRWENGDPCPEHLPLPLPPFGEEARIMTIEESDKFNQHDVLWVLEQMQKLLRKELEEQGAKGSLH